jgi:hypothetical protein
MKNRIKYTSLLAITVLLSVTSCKKSFFSDVNTNPNAPDSATIIPAVLLPTVQLNMAYSEGGDLARYTSLITQQTLGFSRQAQGYYTYVFTSSDFDTPWGNLYTGVLQNNITMIRIADAKGEQAYSGVGRIFLAYTLQVMVDLWGPIPYSEAFKGGGNLRPKFDSDVALYDTIVNLLTTGITQIKTPNTGTDISVPGSEDLMYAGDLGKWELFAHAILARVYIHQSKGDAAMAAKALDEAGKSFTSNSDNAQFIFGATEQTANPVYQFNQQRTDIDMAAGQLIVDMTAKNDPRISQVLTMVDPGYNDVSFVGAGTLYGDISAPVYFTTYEEMQFLKAEAILRSTGDIVGAQAAFRAGITANMERLGVSPDSAAVYIAANGTLPLVVADAIAKVAYEEDIALYLNPEAFTLYRRTGAPALTPVAGSSVPRRLLYPQNEYSNNAANTPSATLFAPTIFWDK